MNKYSDKSDFEINKNVADKLGMEFPELSDKESYKPLAYFTECGNDILCFDPCNNPTDAMPIIFENRINLRTVDGYADYYADHPTNSRIYSHNINPLRAAMEVFLIMKEAE